MSVKHERGNRHLKNPPKRWPKLRYVIDTNVFVEMLSTFDVFKTLEAALHEKGEAALDDDEVIYRVQRARESFLLLLYLDRTEAHTYSHAEAHRKLEEFVRPEEPGTSFGSDFVSVFAHYTTDYVLKRFLRRNRTHKDHMHAKDVVDRYLLRYAGNRKIPVVTNEGHTREGLRDDNTKKNMRGRGRAQGVEVLAPREVYAGKLDEAQAIDDFLRSFRENAPRFLADRGIDDAMPEVLMLAHGAYRFFLRGEVEGRDAPIRLALF